MTAAFTVCLWSATLLSSAASSSADDDCVRRFPLVEVRDGDDACARGCLPAAALASFRIKTLPGFDASEGEVEVRAWSTAQNAATLLRARLRDVEPQSRKAERQRVAEFLVPATEGPALTVRVDVLPTTEKEKRKILAEFDVALCADSEHDCQAEPEPCAFGATSAGATSAPGYWAQDTPAERHLDWLLGDGWRWYGGLRAQQPDAPGRPCAYGIRTPSQLWDCLDGRHISVHGDSTGLGSLSSLVAYLLVATDDVRAVAALPRAASAALGVFYGGAWQTKKGLDGSLHTLRQGPVTLTHQHWFPIFSHKRGGKGVKHSLLRFRRADTGQWTALSYCGSVLDFVPQDVPWMVEWFYGQTLPAVADLHAPDVLITVIGQHHATGLRHVPMGGGRRQRKVAMRHWRQQARLALDAAAAVASNTTWTLGARAHAGPAGRDSSAGAVGVRTVRMFRELWANSDQKAQHAGTCDSNIAAMNAVAAEEAEAVGARVAPSFEMSAALVREGHFFADHLHYDLGSVGWWRARAPETCEVPGSLMPCGKHYMGHVGWMATQMLLGQVCSVLP